MTFNVDHTFIIKEKVSDHKCVHMLLDTRKGDLGHERTTIDEELLMESNIQEDIQEIVTDVYASQRSEMNKSLYQILKKIADNSNYKNFLFRLVDFFQLRTGLDSCSTRAAQSGTISSYS
jgi:uncharacterized protein YihD (DUF1040 family)